MTCFYHLRIIKNMLRNLDKYLSFEHRKNFYKFNKKSSFFSVIILIISCISLYNFTASDFVVMKINHSITEKYCNTKDKFIPSKNAVSITKYLPKGYVTDGSKDYTDFIQRGLNENRNVIMPNFPVLINGKGLKITSDSKIYFDRKSQIIYTGPAVGKFWDIIIIDNVKNVHIFNANIVGSRYRKIKQTGEWSAGITIKDSENIEINNAKITNTWGDGIFIGSEKGKTSKNVRVTNVWIDQARRDGISITSAENLVLNNILISNTHGTLPEMAIQIEPSLHTEELKKIKIFNVHSVNNKTGAFTVNLKSFNHTGKKKVEKEIDIEAENITDESSNYFIGFILNTDKDNITTTGNIKLKNFTGKNIKRTGLPTFEKNNSKVKIEYSNIKYSDKNGNLKNIDLK